MYFSQPHVLSGFEWLGRRVQDIRYQNLNSSRKIKHIRIHKGTYQALFKNFAKYSPFGHDCTQGLTLYGIQLVAYDFDHTMMV